MKYYSRFYTMYRSINCYFLFLAASCFFFASPVANAETFDVNIVNTPKITVDWDDFLNAGQANSDLSAPSSTYDPVYSSDALSSGISEANSLFGYDPTAPSILLSPGRQPWWNNKFRYFTFGNPTLMHNSTQQGYRPNINNLQAGNYTNNGSFYVQDYTMYYSSSNLSLKWSTLQSDILSAFFSVDTFNFLADLLTVWNNAPLGSDFTYTLPSIFGFDSGIEISVPLYSIVNGSGDYSVFNSIFVVTRAFLGVVYYGTVAAMIINSLIYKQ